MRSKDVGPAWWRDKRIRLRVVISIHFEVFRPFHRAEMGTCTPIDDCEEFSVHSVAGEPW